jgi:hypothetical protein
LSTSAGWGARPGRSTTANLEAVTHSIAQSLQQTKCAAIATYDLEDAYNKVDIRILADKLTNLFEMDRDTSRKQNMSNEVWEVEVYRRALHFLQYYSTYSHTTY